MRVVCNSVEAKEWDAYVENHPLSRFCHLSAYRCIQKTYGYTPRYFAFLDGDRIVGTLAAFEAKSLFFGRVMVSQPFSEYGGFLIEEDLPEQDLEAICGQLRRHLAERRIGKIELHGSGLPEERRRAHLRKGNETKCAYLVLDDPERLWKNAFNKEVRKAIKKARRSDLTALDRCSPEVLRDWFFPLYLDSMSRLGVPPHPLAYFTDCLEAFGPRMRIFWALKDEEPIAGLLGFACGQRVSITNIVSDPEHWDLRPNDFVHHEFIAWAYSQGFRFFDFGSVRYEGQLRYKKKWGCSVEDHNYYFLAPEGAGASSVKTFDSSSGTMTMMSRLWSRFVPRVVERRLGPVIRRNLVR